MAGPAYQWGEWRFEPTEARLMRNGEIVQLPAKTLDVLTALLRRAPRLVTKEEIFAAVWPDAAVEEGNIAFHVAALRKAIDGDGPSAIETVRGRGYRFVADVAVGQMLPTEQIQQTLATPGTATPVMDPAMSSHAAPSTAVPATAAPAPARFWARPAIIAAGIILISLAALVMWRVQSSQHEIALRSFEIVNPRPGEENFPDGILTYLSVKLPQVGVAVVPIESATTVLTGQLHPVENGFRVEVQLTGTSNGARMWEWSFDVSFDDERPAPGSGPDDVRSRVQGTLADRVSEGVKSYLSLSGAVPVTR